VISAAVQGFAARIPEMQQSSRSIVGSLDFSQQIANGPSKPGL
jgi:hypothetical protein